MIKSVGEIINSELSKDGTFRKLSLSQEVLEIVRHILGEDLSKQLKILNFKNGTVLIGTPTAVFAQELSFMENDIIIRANKVLGSEIVKKIRFKEVW